MNKKFKGSLAVLILLISTTASIVSSEAASKGYRYWGYFQAAPGATTWTAAMTGPTARATIVGMVMSPLSAP